MIERDMRSLDETSRSTVVLSYYLNKTHCNSIATAHKLSEP